MKPGAGKRRSVKGDRPRRRPRVAGRPRSTSDDDVAEDFAAPTIHDDVAVPLIGKLSHFKVRALAFTVLWLAFFVACQMGTDQLRQESVKLASTGIHVKGTVQKVEGYTEPDSVKITLTYPAGSEPRTIAMPVSAKHGYKIGDKVSLAYASGDPKKVVVFEGRVVFNNPFELLTPLSFSAFLGIPTCLYAAWLWRSRYRSALKTGLREAAATVRPGWLFPKIDVYLEHDYKLLQTRRSLRIAPRFTGLEKVPVFIGGEETDMIVIFPRGRFFKDRLHTVPAKEIEPDTD
ncbi:DUF3592 domain-containing protein [Amycolatopsis sp. WAC 01416]|uniref:DUF3592 domain-containing protein n=1 Tax=Amycolatopsis sp. WAC 01416 TaxID=2203196 RepID=UPI000F7AFCC6|nr:DUF3592 domain-containing protein [Amycolatopsis sp. WAC 01416]